MRNCPDCNKRTKKVGDPTISEDGYFLDQIIECVCGWCGVETKMLTSLEATAYRAKPKQLRMEFKGGEE